MKSLFKLSVFALLMVLCTSTVMAQTPWKEKKVFTGTDKRVWVNDAAGMQQVSTYQLDSITTTDSTITAIDTVYVGTNESGILKVAIIGFIQSTGATVTGIKYVRYKKVAGTLTLGTPADALASEADTQLGTPPFTMSATSNKIIVTVKGKAATTVKWTSYTERLAKFRLL